MKRKTLATPLRVVDFSNSSQIVSLFTREGGLIDGIAKGAYREKSSFQTPFDLAVLHEVVLVEKSSGLAILTESAVVDGYRGIRKSWKRHLAASHVLEFLRAVTTAGEPDQRLFDCCAETFRYLSASETLKVGACLAWFEARALRILGLLAPMGSCARCGRRWPGGRQAVLVSPSAGGILCTRCRGPGECPGGLLLPGGALELLQAFVEDGGSTCAFAEAGAPWELHGGSILRVLSELRTRGIERELTLLRRSSGWT